MSEDISPERLAAARAMAGSFIRSEADLRAFARRLPADVTLRNVQNLYRAITAPDDATMAGE